MLHGQEQRPPTDRELQEIALRLASPMRPGAIDAKDANHLPLFMAANEPRLALEPSRAR